MATSEGTVIACHSLDAWTTNLQEGADSKKLGPSFDKGVPLLELIIVCGGCSPWEELSSTQFKKKGYQCLLSDAELHMWFITPVLVELAKKLHDVIFLKVDVDELRDVAAEWKVEAMPTFIFIKEGKEIDRLVGARKEELQTRIETHMVPISAA